jgi:hypothetical protein
VNQCESIEVIEYRRWHKVETYHHKCPFFLIAFRPTCKISSDVKVGPATDRDEILIRNYILHIKERTGLRESSLKKFYDMIESVILVELEIK